MKASRLFGLGLSAALVATAAGRPVPFTAGNLVVVQAGDGSAALDSSAWNIIVKEVSVLDGSVVQSIPLPVLPVGANHAITLSGTSGSQGFISRSTDNQYFLLTGFDAPVGTIGVSTSTPDVVARVVARIDMNGNVDTTTALGDAYSGDLIRGAVSSNGTDIWTSGTGSIADSAGVRYCTLGATTSTQLASDATNTRDLVIAGGNLYASSASGAFVGVNQVGLGLPTTSGQTTTLLPGFPAGPAAPSPYGMFFSDANTLYVADDNLTTNGGGIQKWTQSGGVWTLQYTLDTGQGVRGLAGVVNAGVVTLYANGPAGATSVLKITDTGATATPTTLLAAPNNTAFRGVAVVPGTPPATGACCLAGGACSVLTQNGCTAQAGIYQGNSISCSSANCGTRSGACCLTTNACTLLTATQCSGQSGIYRGDGTGCATTACSPSYTPGNLLVLQAGDGTTTVNSGNAAPLFLREIRISDGATIQSTALPGVVSSVGNRAITGVGNSTTEGSLERSLDGAYVLTLGYNAAPGTAGIGSSGGSTSRVVCRINGAGFVDTTTAFADNTFAGSSPRGVASTNGQSIWISGNGTNALDGGTRFLSYGATSSLQICALPNNERNIGIFNGQLYMGSASGAFIGLNTVGTGEPTTAGQTATLLPGVTTNNTKDFFFSDPNTLYLGLSAGTNVLEKWTFNGTSWTQAYVLNNGGAFTSPLQCLTGVVNSGVVTIYGTLQDTVGAGNRLVSVTDTGSSASPYTVIATAPNLTWWKGIAFAPTAASTPCYANCDHSTTLPCLNVLDFGCFLNKFAAGDPVANCDGSTTPPVLNVLDFGCFLNKFAAGCSNC
jgi:hypothetical protein